MLVPCGALHFPQRRAAYRRSVSTLFSGNKLPDIRPYACKPFHLSKSHIHQFLTAPLQRNLHGLQQRYPVSCDFLTALIHEMTGQVSVAWNLARYHRTVAFLPRLLLFRLALLFLARLGRHNDSYI